jgi:hypothetical protein
VGCVGLELFVTKREYDAAKEAGKAGTHRVEMKDLATETQVNAEAPMKFIEIMILGFNALRLAFHWGNIAVVLAHESIDPSEEFRAELREVDWASVRDYSIISSVTISVNVNRSS